MQVRGAASMLPHAPPQSDAGALAFTPILKASKAALSLKLESGSLLVFEGDAYEKYWHGILPAEDCPLKQRRLSFTVRRVAKVLRDDEVLDTAEWAHEQKRRESLFYFSVSDARKLT